MKISGCRKIVGGVGEGRALVSSQPINFLAMVDANTGKITDEKHELFGRSLKDVVLVFPNAVGSSVGAYAFYSLRESGSAPAAIVCSRADITTASGCAIASIPAVDLPEKKPLSSIAQGARVRVNADKGTIATV
ncbi:aconitase X swivel domain-containing protein [Nitrososphaera sp.]|uniref:aconitase X swivel domain-containing protein n=1 Tax=Nitrososphaera sp. TaxID=1971748 RepID=UPI002ED7BEBA